MLTKYRNGRMLLEVRANSQSKATANDKLRTVTIPAQEATPDSFAAFGQVCAFRACTVERATCGSALSASTHR